MYSNMVKYWTGYDLFLREPQNYTNSITETFITCARLKSSPLYTNWGCCIEVNVQEIGVISKYLKELPVLKNLKL